jgi:hypothetical protein
MGSLVSRVTKRAAPGVTRASTTALLLILLLVGAGCGDAPQEPEARDLGVVRTYDVTSRKHVTGHVNYAQTPPVGGDHSSDVERCGFHSRRLTTERAVHSMEHGAVWITYRPSLPAGDRETLRRLAAAEHYLLVSEWNSTLPAPIVASAWGRQLRLASASDPQLQEFITAYVKSAQAPEPGAFC